MTATAAYRDSLEGLRLRYAELCAERSGYPSPARAPSVFAARTGRIWAGNVGIAGAVVLASISIVALIILSTLRARERKLHVDLA